DHVSQLDVSDRARRAANLPRDALVALGPDGAGRRPRNALTGTNLALPLRGDVAEEIGEDVARPRAVRPMDHDDGHVGKVNALIELGDLRVVPLENLSELDVGDYLGAELDRRGDARHVVSDRRAAERD